MDPLMAAYGPQSDSSSHQSDQSASGGRRSATFNQQPAHFNQQPAAFNQQPATFNQQPATFNQQPDPADNYAYQGYQSDASTIEWESPESPDYDTYESFESTPEPDGYSTYESFESTPEPSPNQPPIQQANQPPACFQMLLGPNQQPVQGIVRPNQQPAQRRLAFDVPPTSTGAAANQPTAQRRLTFDLHTGVSSTIGPALTAFNPVQMYEDLIAGIRVRHEDWEAERASREFFQKLGLSADENHRANLILRTMADDSMTLTGRLKAAAFCADPSQQLYCREQLTWAMNIFNELLGLTEDLKEISESTRYIIKPNVPILLQSCSDRLRECLQRQQRSVPDMALMGKNMHSIAKIIIEYILRQKALLQDPHGPGFVSTFQQQLMDIGDTTDESEAET